MYFDNLKGCNYIELKHNSIDAGLLLQDNVLTNKIEDHSNFFILKYIIISNIYIDNNFVNEITKSFFYNNCLFFFDFWILLIKDYYRILILINK